MEQFAVFKHFMNVIAVFDEDACFVYINDAGLEKLEKTSEEVLGVSLKMFFPGKYESTLEKIAKTIRHREVQCYYDSFILPDEKEHFFHVVLQPYGIENARTYALVELKEAGEETESIKPLDEVQQRYKSTFEASHVGIANVALDGRFISTNEALRTMLGYGREEMLQLTISEITHFEELPGDWALVQEMVAGHQRIVDKKSRLIRKNGDVLWVHIYASAVYDEQNKAQYLIGNIVNIDSEVRYQKRLAKKEQLLSKTQHIAHIGNWEYDFRKDKIKLSDELFQILEIEFQSEPLEYAQLQQHMHPEDEALLIDTCETAIGNHQEVCNVTLRFVTKSAKVIYVDVQGEILYTDASRPVKIIGTAHNITAYKLQQQALEESRQQFKRLAEEIGPMVMLYRHDGTGVLGYVSPGVETVFDVKPSEVVGKNFTEIVRWTEASLRAYKMTLDEMHATLKTHSAYDMTFSVDNATSKTIHIIEHALHNRLNELYAVEGIAIDVSKKRADDRRLEEYKHILNVTKDPISMIDTTYHYRIVNLAYTKIFNRPYDEIINIHAKELLGNEFFESKIKKRLQRCFKGEEVHYREWFNMPDGKRYFYDVYYSPYMDSAGTIRGALVAVRDVTEQKLAETALKREKEFSDALFGFAGPLMVVLDRNGRIIRFNSAAERITGYRFKEVKGKEFWGVFLPKEEHAKVMEVFQNIQKGQLVERFENHWVMRDGSMRLFDWSNALVMDESNEVDAIISVGFDITQRSETEKDLAKERDFNETLFSAAGALMVVLDSRGYIVRFNRAAELKTEHTFEEVAHKPFWEIFIPQEEREEVGRAFDSILDGVNVDNFENHWVMKNGEKRLFHWSSATIRDEEGRVDYIISVGIDITDRKQMELAVVEQEKVLRNVIDNIPQGIVMVDNALNVVVFNALAYRLFGMPPETYRIGKNFEEIIRDWADATGQDDAMRTRAIEELYVNKPFVIEFPQTIDGHMRWMHITHTPLGGGGFIRTFVDITERKKMEVSYKGALDHLSMATRAGRIGTWDLDLKSGELKWDAVMFELYDVDPNEFSADYNAWVKHIHPEDLPYVQQKVNQSIENNLPLDMQFRIIDKRGDIVYLLISAKVYYDENGKPSRMIGINADITVTKEMEFELRELNETLEERVSERTKALQKQSKQTRMLLDSLPLMVIYKDTHNTILDVNKPVAESLGVRVEEMQNKHIKLFFPADAEKYYQDDREVISSRKPKMNFVERYETPFGDKWTETSKVPLFDEEDAVSGLIVIIRDITQVRTLEKEKEIQEKMLVQQSKMAAMGEMIGAIAHQWRQPLNNMSVLKDLLVDDYEFGELNDEKIKEFEKDMNLQLQYMSKTIDDFRNFFLPNRQVEAFNLIDVLQQTLKIVSTQLESHHIGVSFNTQHPPVMLQGYPNELMQVVLNIFNNAKDAIINNSVMQGVITIEVEESDTHAALIVCDNGGGIPVDVVDRIFDPYFTTKFQSKGTGLGLYMSKMLIERNMDGKLNVKNLKEGACFTITLKKEEQ